MSKKLNHLLAQQQQLIERAAAEREVLSMHFTPWRKPISFLEHGINIAAYLKRYTLLISLCSLFLTYRYSSKINWIQRILHISKFVQRIRNFLRT
jgi:hypothetical protein